MIKVKSEYFFDTTIVKVDWQAEDEIFIGSEDNLSFAYKGKYFLNYLKARSKVRSLNIGSATEWKKYCYLNTNLPYGVPESPEIVYRNNGWKNFNDWLGIRIIKKLKRRRKKKKN